jgi:hypothetical protein
MPDMRRSACWVAVTVITAFIAGSAPTALAGQASGSVAGWRIAATFPVGSTVDHLAASGPHDIWAVESCRKPCVSSDGLILRRWDGTAWRPRLQSPAVAKHTGNAEPVLVMSPGSQALWAVYGLYGGQPRATAVRWTGTSWGTPTVFPLNTHLMTAVAPSPSSAWLFGGAGAPFTYRYNGKAWAKAPAPNFGGFGPFGSVAMSARDIWLLGVARHGFRMAVSRWTGTRWVDQAMPAAPHGADGITGGGLIASGPASLWGFGYSGFTAGTDWLVHWNGKTWSNVKVPYRLSNAAGGFIGSDGRNGVWFEAGAAGSSREFLYHDTASGHWSVQPVPSPAGTMTTIFGFVQVPGTTSVYAYGTAENLKTGATQGVILRSA